MTSPNVLAQNGHATREFSPKRGPPKTVEKRLYFAILKVFVPTAAGTGRSKTLSCPA